MGIYFTIKYKTHTDIETKVSGKECILDMHVYGNFVSVLGGGGMFLFVLKRTHYLKQRTPNL